MRLELRHHALIALSLALAACGGAPVRDEDVFHEPGLRAGSVPARDDVERELLAVIATAPPEQPIEVRGRTFVAHAAYASASGRLCTWVDEPRATSAPTRLACEGGDGWVFVPDVFGGDDPFAEPTETP
ncbi:hypothetical protein [Sandaracinus amylolyticus]|uniref:hypothetical protein n=1 Tax=Sandaracinus amylolyticus TaxID=927083 RepID=UPI001F2747E4|nr:hypothetical protein [Sandaracinus amylolyticus]UJR86896.1 Hypothetical protein I5071_89970 [Sandaracinus amylolyticus]